MEPPAPLPPHPLAGATTRVFVIAAGMVALGLWQLSSGVSSAWVLVVGGSVLAFSGWRQRSVIAGVQAANLAHQHLLRGENDAARVMLARVPATAMRNGIVGRACDVEIAHMAIAGGRFDEAIAATTRATVRPVSIRTRAHARMQIAAALSLRALAHATKGNLDEASTDAATTQAMIEAWPDAIARASLVEVMVAVRRGAPDLGTRIAKASTIVLEHATPRDRALFRAFRAMAAGKRAGLYREAATRDDDVEGQGPGALARWIAGIAPDAAPFVERDDHVATTTTSQAAGVGASPAQIDALDRARTKVAPRAPISANVWTQAILWGPVAAMFVSVWFLVGSEDEGTRSVATPLFVNVVPLILLGALCIVFYRVTVGPARQESRLAEARRNAMIARTRGGSAELASLASHANRLVAASARLELSNLAFAEADFARAGTEARTAIAWLSTKKLRAASADLILPLLVTQSAATHASCGEHEESEADLARLHRDFPTFAYLPIARARVKILSAARADDRDALLALAQDRPAELWLPRREEMLCELALAASRPTTTADERKSLAAELDDDPRLTAFVDAVAPGLRERALRNERH